MQSFVMRVDSHSPKGESTRMLTYVAPDKLRIDLPDKESMVVIGSLAWVRDKDGKWQKKDMTGNVGFLKAVHDPNAAAGMIEGMKVAYLGSETLDGVATHVFSIAPIPLKGFTAKTERVWLGAADGFPRKIEQKNGAFSSTVTYSQLNAPLSVAAQ